MSQRVYEAIVAYREPVSAEHVRACIALHDFRKQLPPQAPGGPRATGNAAAGKRTQAADITRESPSSRPGRAPVRSRVVRLALNWGYAAPVGAGLVLLAVVGVRLG